MNSIIKSLWKPCGFHCVGVQTQACLPDWLLIFFYCYENTFWSRYWPYCEGEDPSSTKSCEMIPKHLMYFAIHSTYYPWLSKHFQERLMLWDIFNVEASGLHGISSLNHRVKCCTGQGDWGKSKFVRKKKARSLQQPINARRTHCFQQGFGALSQGS